VIEIIATRDHLSLDAAGGLLIAGLGYAAARAIHRNTSDREPTPPARRRT